jgi:hypothetical protein
MKSLFRYAKLVQTNNRRFPIGSWLKDLIVAYSNLEGDRKVGNVDFPLLVPLKGSLTTVRCPIVPLRLDLTAFLQRIC